MKILKVFTSFTVVMVFGAAQGQYALFSRGTDTLNFGNLNTVGTTAYTIEAVFQPTQTTIARLFTEQRDNGEDKQMSVGQSGTVIGAWTPQNNWATGWNGTISGDRFHHVAWVRSGAVESTYLDGIRVHTLTLTGTDNVPISNVSDSVMSLGAYQYKTAGLATSFTGWVDSIRVSNIDRYSGATASVTIGDQVQDANTQLLVNFDASAPFRDVVSGRDGIGGSGSLTAPTAVPEPTTLAGALVAAVAWRSRRKRR